MESDSVLIVDDDEGFRDSLKDILEEHGYNVTCAGTCAGALTITSELMPAAALLDIKLPDGSGTALLSELKKINKECVCTMMTAFADLRTAVQALEHGAYHYLQKPFQPLELLNLLEKIFETIRLRQKNILAEKELRESQITVRSLLDASPYDAMLVDLDGKIIAANQSIAKLMNKSIDEMIGIDSSILNSKEVAENRKQKFHESVQTGKTVIFEEMDNGKFFETIISPVISDNRDINRAAIFCRDITDAKLAEEETRQLEASLAHSQRMEAVGTLAGGIAHDFNNLLQGVLGYTEILLMDREEDNREFRMLKNIEQAARRASELTRQLLTFSRKVNIELKPLNLSSVLKQSEELFRRTIPKMIEIEFHLDSELHYISADPTQMEQILMNLVVNARDAILDGGKIIVETINVSLDEKFCKINPECQPGDYVLLKVSDTGKGMDIDIKEHIFEPFFTTKEPGKGTGLGLAMVFGIVKTHSGLIICDSEKNSGTSFRIYFPVVQLEDEEDFIEKKEEPEMPHYGSETILVVEDEETLRAFAMHFLKRFGYNVLTAENGESALKIYKNNPDSISLILMDLIMPGMGGKRCMEEMLRLNPKQKIIIASGYAGEDSKALLLENGARGFVPKPYNIKMILKMIRQVLDSQH
jgi:two-component system, cell cycle sensor histidine kinase and response regulator CckA